MIVYFDTSKLSPTTVSYFDAEYKRAFGEVRELDMDKQELENPYAYAYPYHEPLFKRFNRFPALNTFNKVPTFGWDRIFSRSDQARGFHFNVNLLTGERVNINVYREFWPEEVEFAEVGMKKYAKHHPIFGSVFRDCGEFKVITEENPESGKTRITVSLIATEQEVSDRLWRTKNSYRLDRKMSYRDRLRLTSAD